MLRDTLTLTKSQKGFKSQKGEREQKSRRDEEECRSQTEVNHFLAKIYFKNFESKLHPGLFMAGEVLNIDAVTGGFNFQAAWTGGYMAGLEMGKPV